MVPGSGPGREACRVRSAWAHLLLAAASGVFGGAQAAVVVRRHSSLGPPECKSLQDAIVVDPPATCRYATYAGEWHGCTCAIPLPVNVDQLPNMAKDPYAIDASVGQAPPGYQPAGFAGPPANPAMPYNAPPMPAICPFSSACGPSGGFNCVGFDSWGFSSASLAEYSPQSAYLKTMSCSYMMKKGGNFVVPPKVVSYHRMMEQRNDAQEAYGQKLDAVCPQLPSSTTLGDFCQALFAKQNLCGRTWAELTKSCSKATPPHGLAASSQGYHICPFECEDPNHSGYGPSQYSGILSGAA